MVPITEVSTVTYITDESCRDPADRDSAPGRHVSTFHQGLSISVNNLYKFDGAIPRHFTKWQEFPTFQVVRHSQLLLWNQIIQDMMVFPKKIALFHYLKLNPFICLPRCWWAQKHRQWIHIRNPLFWTWAENIQFLLEEKSNSLYLNKWRFKRDFIYLWFEGAPHVYPSQGTLMSLSGPEDQGIHWFLVSDLGLLLRGCSEFSLLSAYSVNLGKPKKLAFKENLLSISEGKMCQIKIVLGK